MFTWDLDHFLTRRQTLQSEEKSDPNKMRIILFALCVWLCQVRTGKRAETILQKSR